MTFARPLQILADLSGFQKIFWFCVLHKRLHVDLCRMHKRSAAGAGSAEKAPRIAGLSGVCEKERVYERERVDICMNRSGRRLSASPPGRTSLLQWYNNDRHLSYRSHHTNVAETSSLQSVAGRLL